MNKIARFWFMPRKKLIMFPAGLVILVAGGIITEVFLSKLINIIFLGGTTAWTFWLGSKMIQKVPEEDNGE